MTRTVVVVDAFAPFKEIVRRMQEYRVSAIPVVDEDGLLLGIVSEGDLILKEDPTLDGDAHRFESTRRRLDRSKAAGLIASELLTAPVITIEAEASLGEAARLMHRHRIKRLPVVDGDGRLAGIVSRADLLKVFLRDDAAIAKEIREDVLRRTLWIEPETVTVSVREGVVRLEGQLERRSLLPVLERLVLSTEGVVAIEAALSWIHDDVASEIPVPWATIAPRGSSTR
jgi:CBS domain-containing protein